MKKDLINKYMIKGIERYESSIKVIEDYVKNTNIKFIHDMHDFLFKKIE